MSFADAPDPMLQEMLLRANARGVVLTAAVGNAGPKSATLFPPADAAVIGVTATDAEDRLIPQANRDRRFRWLRPGLRLRRLRRKAPIRSLPVPRLLPPMPAAWRR